MLYVPEIRSASAVWVNGRKIHSAGRVGTDRDEEIPRPKNGIYDLRADNGGGPLREAEIVVQVSSYDRFFGGIRNNFHIGADSVLLHWAVGRWASAASLAGAFLVIGLYHFMLWLFQRPRYTAYLVFAAHCAVGGVRFLIEKDSVVQYLASESLAAFINPVSTFLLTLHSLTGAALVLFVFEIRQGRAMLAFYSISFAALLAAQLFLPMPLRYVLGIFCLVPMTAFLVQAARALSARRFREHPWLWLYFVSFALYCVWAPFGNTRMDRYFFLPHIAPNIFITLVQLVTLSLDYAETKRREQELATKTDFYHRMSHDLLTPLTVVSTNIQVANMKSETDHERLADSQTEIMKMAAMISEALVEGRGEEGADR
jgi:signal transduction histidine kinase